MPMTKDPVKRKAWQALYRKRVRDAVFAGYENKCGCCGETRKEFLSLDHVNGGGCKERGKGRGQKVYIRAIRECFPPDLQLLCMNCNWSRGKYGYCPHERE